MRQSYKAMEALGSVTKARGRRCSAFETRKPSVTSVCRLEVE